MGGEDDGAGLRQLIEQPHDADEEARMEVRFGLVEGDEGVPLAQLREGDEGEVGELAVGEGEGWDRLWEAVKVDDEIDQRGADGGSADVDDVEADARAHALQGALPYFVRGAVREPVIAVREVPAESVELVDDGEA